MGQVVIDFSFASNRLSKLSNFSGPITVQSEAKLMPSQVTFDTQKKVSQESFECFSNLIYHHLSFSNKASRHGQDAPSVLPLIQNLHF